MHSRARKKIAKRVVGEPRENDSLKKNNSGRASEALTEQRVQHVYDLLVACENRRDIIRNTKGWGLSEAAIDQYIYKARKLMVEEMRVGRIERRALLNNRLIRQYVKADRGETAQDAKAAAQILEIAAKINGDLAPLEIEMTEKKQHDLSKLTDEELRTFQAILKKIES